MTLVLQRSPDGATGWTDIVGTTDVSSYVVAAGDSGYYLRVKETKGGVVAYSSVFGPITAAGGALSGVYFSARIDGAFYNTYYGSPTTSDAPWAANDPSPNNWDLFESHAGKKVSAVLWGGGTGVTSFSPTVSQYARNRGAFSLYTMAPTTQNVLDLAANSNANGYLTTVDNWATAVQNQGYPMLLRPMWEMNGNWGYAWQTGAGVTAAQYVAAWQTLYSRINTIAHCVSFCWCPNVVATADPTPWFPGSSYVDWMGMDGYNKGANQSPSALFAATVTTLGTLGPGKPIAICETGCEAPTSYTGGKSQWITDFFAFLAANNTIKFFSWFNQGGSPSFPHIEVGNANTTFDAEAETAFRNGVADPRYLANVVTPTTFPTGQKVPVPA